jgi:hypothetical protein
MSVVVQMNPGKITEAVSNPQFYMQRAAFWKLLQYMFTDFQGQKVYTFVPPDTFRQVSMQLHRLVESYMVVHTGNDNVNLHEHAPIIYHTYFLLLRNIRAQKTVTRMMADETPAQLMSLYKLYCLLLELKAGPMPLFAHHLP